MADTIKRVGLTHLQVPLKEPLRISGGEVAVKDAILVAVETAGGLVGVGEARRCRSRSLGGGLTIEACWRRPDRDDRPRPVGQRFGTTRASPRLAARWGNCSRSAVAGAETALWDLLWPRPRHEPGGTPGGLAEAIAPVSIRAWPSGSTRRSSTCSGRSSRTWPRATSGSRSRSGRAGDLELVAPSGSTSATTWR